MFNFQTKLLSAIFACLLLVSTASAEYFSDVILTGTEGIWVDSRSYASLQHAITAVGAADREIVIIGEQATTILTIPANVRLKFLRDGSINNAGQLNINTRNIVAGDRQIFTGLGDIDFADGSVVRSSWFLDIIEALDVTYDDCLTLVISEPGRVNSSVAVGNNVTLKWESSDNLLIVYGGRVLSNVKNITAGNYQIFAGAGDVDFLDNTDLRLSWFRRLRSATTWVETEEVSLTIDDSDTMIANVTVPESLTLKFIKGNTITTTGHTLTINGLIETGLHQIFAGTGTVTGLDYVIPQWWGAIGDGVADDYAALQAAVTCLPEGGSFFLPTGGYLCQSSLTIPVPIFFVGEGVGSTIILDIDAVTDGIVVGIAGTSHFSMLMRDIAIFGKNASCRNGLVVHQTHHSVFDNVTVKCDAAEYAVKISGCVMSTYDFDVHAVSGSHPFVAHAAAPTNGVRMTTQIAPIPYGVNANTLHADIAGCAGTGLYIETGSDGKGNIISGVIDNVSGHPVYCIGGREMVFRSMYLESNTLSSYFENMNECTIENSGFIDGSAGIELVDCERIKIDNIKSAAISIDSDCLHTTLGRIQHVGTITDSGEGTIYEGPLNWGVAPMNADPSNVFNMYADDRQNLLYNGSFARWESTTKPDGWGDPGGNFSYSKETGTVHFLDQSCKVTTTDVNAVLYMEQDEVALAMRLKGQMATFSSWVYISSAGNTGTFQIVLRSYNGVSNVDALMRVTTEDAWVRASVATYVPTDTTELTFRWEWTGTGAKTYYVAEACVMAGTHGQQNFIYPQFESAEYQIIAGHKIEFMTAAEYGAISGWHNRGDIIYRSDATAGANAGWMCITEGDPGTWKEMGDLDA